MAVRGTGVFAPGATGILVENRGAIPGREVHQPGFAILAGGAAREGDVSLDAVDVLAHFAADQVATPFTAIVLVAVMAVDGGEKFTLLRGSLCQGVLTQAQIVAAAPLHPFSAPARRGGLATVIVINRHFRL